MDKAVMLHCSLKITTSWDIWDDNETVNIDKEIKLQYLPIQ